MSRFCEIRLVDFVMHTKTANKRKKVMAELDSDDKKPKRNRRESVFSNTDSIMAPITENLRNKSKSRAVSRTSLRIIDGSHQKSNSGIKRITFSDSLKLNNSVEACGSNENIKLYNPKLGCQVIKRIIGGTGKKISSHKSLKTNLINSKEESTFNIHKGYKKKKSKTHHKFWESKLTGARRVSKRLTKLKFTKKNSMNPETASEKYIFTNASHLKYNQENKPRAQRSVRKNVSKNKLKMNRNTTVQESTSPSNQHMGPQPKSQTKYEGLCDKTHVLPNFFNPKKVSNELSGPTTFCEIEDNKLFMSSISAVLKSGTKEISCSSVDQEEEANDLVHIALEMKNTSDPTLEDNSFSSNKITDNIIENTTETVIFDEIQNEYKENTEDVIIIETEKDISSYIPEKCDTTISSEYIVEKDNEKKETNGTTYILIPNSLMPLNENHRTSLECNSASFSENEEITVNNVKGKVDFTPVEILVPDNI